MSHPVQTVLLYHTDSHVVDRVFALCEDANLHVRILTAFSQAEVRAYLSNNPCAVVIALCTPLADRQLARIFELHYPCPLIALLDCGDNARQMTAALRQGASDIFVPERLMEEEEGAAFIASLKVYLDKARLVDENQQYREELELSLAELKADQKAALQIQQRMLPPHRVDLAADIRASYCLTPSLYLSGDFVDMVVLNKRFAMFYLADVSGHGASSALVTVLLKNMTNRLVRNFQRGSSFDILAPASTLMRANQELLDTGLGKHLTMFIGLFDLENDTLRYAVGGHHPMPVLRTGQGVRFLEGRGMPVGLFEEPFFEEREMALPERFSLTVFSDGILEMLGSGSMAEKEARLCEVVSQQATTDPVQLRDALATRSVTDAPDDIAVMILARP